MDIFIKHLIMEDNIELCMWHGFEFLFVSFFLCFSGFMMPQ